MKRRKFLQISGLAGSFMVFGNKTILATEAGALGQNQILICLFRLEFRIGFSRLMVCLGSSTYLCRYLT